MNKKDLFLKATRSLSSTERSRKERNSFSIRICKVCGKEFSDKRNDALYCSDACQEWAHELLRFRSNENRYDYLDAEGEDDY